MGTRRIEKKNFVLIRKKNKGKKTMQWLTNIRINTKTSHAYQLLK